jgi:hypothetical protein
VKEWLRIHRVATLVIATVVGAAALLYGYARTFLDFQPAVSVLSARSSEAGRPALGLRIDRNPLRHEQPLELWVEVQNRTDHDWRVTVEELSTPGFRPAASTPGHHLRASGDHYLALPAAISTPSHTTRSLSAVLVAREGAGTFTLTGRFRIQPAAAGSGDGAEVVVALEGVRVVSWYRILGANTVVALGGLLGVLGIPLFLAFLGHLLQLRQQKLQFSREAWASFIPQNHENTIRYYLPLAGAISTFERQLETCRSARRGGDGPLPAEPLDRAFFALLFTLRRHRAVGDGPGGFYLARLQGERLISQGLGLFIGQLLLAFPYEDVSTLLDAMGTQESYSTWRSKLRAGGGARRSQRDVWPPPGVQLRAIATRLKVQFQDWLIDPERAWAFDVLTLAGKLLIYEINKLYEYWYEEEQVFPPEATGRIEKLRSRNVEEVHTFLAELADYQQKESDLVDGPGHGKPSNAAPA